MSDSGFAVVSLLADPPRLDARVIDLSGALADNPADAGDDSDTSGAPEVSALLAALAAADVFDPWVLVGEARRLDLVNAIVDGALGGALGVFGLAAVVVVGGDVPRSVRDHEVPAASTQRVDLAETIARITDEVARRGPRVPAPWARIIASSRTDVAMRATLARRALADDPAYRPRALRPDQLALLREISRHVIPQGEGAGIDLAARLDRMIDAGEGDGWRPAGMSSDAEAYDAGLDALAAIWVRSVGAQEAVIRTVVEGTAPSGDRLSPGQLALWFEDARNDLARVWLSHPASLARVGYSGFATGGTGPEPAGYRVLAAGEREEWEPEELGRLAPKEGPTS